MRANLIIFILFPFLIWLFILLVIINAVKGNFKKSPGHRSQQTTVNRNRGYSKQQPTIRMSADRPKMQQGLFDMNLGKGKKEKKSSALAATRTPLAIKKKHSPNRISVPTNPNSSPITDRIKSLSEKGKKRYFWRERKSPVPNRPPFPSAYSDCIS